MEVVYTQNVSAEKKIHANESFKVRILTVVSSTPMSISLQLLIQIHTVPLFTVSHTHTHASPKYGSTLGACPGSVWTGEEQVYCCQQRLINSQPVIWDGLHIYVIILKTLCQQTLLRPFNLPPERKQSLSTKGVCGMMAHVALLLCNKLVCHFENVLLLVNDRVS